VAFGVFVYAFQLATNDGPYFSAWLIAFTLSFVGVILWSRGMRKQRIAAEVAQEKANAETVAKQTIERARKR
jgi:cbb3-type cytochrome oxidase subunit 3